MNSIVKVSLVETKNIFMHAQLIKHLYFIYFQKLLNLTSRTHLNCMKNLPFVMHFKGHASFILQF